MFEDYELKRKCDRNNYRVVAEIKNNGIAEFLVEFQKPLVTFPISFWPQFNIFGRWELSYFFVSSHKKEIENLPEAGWVEARFETIERAYKEIELELPRRMIQYGSLINKRKVV